MYAIRDKKGFSLVETMIATMVLVVGLTGVAAMQMTALEGSMFANSQSSGAGIALAWEEWLTGLMKNPDQDTEVYFGDIQTLHPENFVELTSLDADNPNDKMDVYDNRTMSVFDPDAIHPPTPFVQVEMPATTQELLAMLNGEAPFVTTDGYSVRLQFRKQGSIEEYLEFEAKDLPPLAPPGSRMVWRIAANVPVVNTATVEISIIYINAFIRSRGVTLRFVVGASMWGA
jgi:prepilin-type N-terminal cleavage/methylation domain-containing protein